MPEPLDPSVYQEIVRTALLEDVGAGDITTNATVDPLARARGVFVVKAPTVVSGLDLTRDVFRQVHPFVRQTDLKKDGDLCGKGTAIASVEGPAASLLVAERTALNFLQYLSGIATLTRSFVDAAGGKLTVLDTRKTTPTFRTLAKYAVKCGGGTNHRHGLYDGILIKDNHIRLAGGIGPAVVKARRLAPGMLVEVETQSLAEVDQALEAGADRIMLDNLDETSMRDAVQRIAGRAQVELSGNMTLARVRQLASIGADFISIGALTHSAPAADISFEIDTPTPLGAVPLDDVR
jgi:nicotinate-nucleotide pyrophosphorylase (carboxylating)